MEIVQRIRCILYVLAFCVRISDSRLTCEGIYRVTQNVKTVISCQYEHSFHAVRWYFDRNDESFLRIDRVNKYGSGYDSGEFDINSDGSMIINNPEIRNEGIYTISVLHEDGRSSKRDMEIQIIVPLDALRVIDCRASSSHLCTQDGINGTNFLLCEARNARPKVGLTWMELGPTGMRKVQRGASTVSSLDGLYNTISTLTYDANKIYMQLFACVANGDAVIGIRNASIIVKGELRVSGNSYHEEYVEIGDNIRLICPVNSYRLAEIEATLLDGTKKVIMEPTPAQTRGRCIDHNTCHKTESGHVDIFIETYKQEGLYVCISSNGETSTKSETNITVIISPKYTSVLVEGCENQQDCTKISGLSGKVTCIASGMRPPTQLTWDYDLPSDMIEISETESFITFDNETGTSTVTATAEYTFTKCDDRAKLVCSSTTHKYHRNISSTHIHIITDGSRCSSEAPVALIIVLLLLVLAAVIIIVIGIKFKKQGKLPWQRNNLFKSDTESMAGEKDIRENVKMETKAVKDIDSPNNDEVDANVSSENAPLMKDRVMSDADKGSPKYDEIDANVNSENSPLVKSQTMNDADKESPKNDDIDANVNSENSPLVKDQAMNDADSKRVLVEFKKVLKQFQKDTKQKKKKVQQFDEVLNTFDEKHRVNLPTNLHGIVLKLPKKDALRVVGYLVECPIKWTEEYITITSELLLRKKMETKTVIHHLMKSETYATKVPDILLQLYGKSTVTKEDIILVTSPNHNEENKIFYLHFLPAVVEHCDKGYHKSETLQLSNEILHVHMDSKVPFGANILSPSFDYETIMEKYLQIILFALNNDEKKIATQIYVSLCKELVGEAEERKTIYHNTLLDCSIKEWFDPKTVLDCLQRSLQESLIDTNILVQVVTKIFFQEKINYLEYVNFLLEQKMTFEQTSSHWKSQTLTINDCEKLVRTVVEFFTRKEIGQKEMLPFITYSESELSTVKIAYPYFLHSIHDKLARGQSQEDHLCNLFHDICDRAMKTEDDINKDELCTSHIKEVISEKFHQILLLSLAKQKISSNTYLDIMNRNIKEEKLQKSEFSKVVEDCSTKTWMDKRTLIEVLRGSWEINLLNDEVLMNVLINTFAMKRIKAADVVATMQYVISKRHEAVPKMLDVVSEAYLGDKISKEELAEITKDFVTNKKITIQMLFQRLTTWSKPNKISIDRVISAIVYYYMEFQVLADDLKTVIGYGDADAEGFENSSNKVSHLYFLHFIHQITEEKIQQLFHDVITDALKNFDHGRKIEKALTKKDSVKIFVRFLLFLRTRDKITPETHKALLQRQDKIDMTVYNDILKADSSKSWFNQTKLLEILNHDDNEHLITAATFREISMRLYVEGKIDEVQLTEITKHHIDEGRSNFAEIYSDMNRLSKDSEDAMQRIIYAVLQYWINSLISQDDVWRNINITGPNTNEQKINSGKIPFVRLLMSIFIWIEKGNVKQHFDFAVQKGLTAEGETGNILFSQLTGKENPSQTFVWVLLVSVANKRITTTSFTDIMKNLEKKIGDGFFEYLSEASDKNWLAVEDLKNVLRECLKKKLVTPEQFVKLLINVYLQKRIEEDDYAMSTVFLIDNKQITLDKVFEQLKTSAEAKSSTEEVMKATLQYYLHMKDRNLEEVTKAMQNSYSLTRTAVQELSETLLDQHLNKKISFSVMMNYIGHSAVTMENKIPYPYILESVQRHSALSKDLKGDLFALFRDILTKAMDQENQHGKEIKDGLSSKGHVPSVFLRALFFSVEKKVIDTNQCMDILISSVDGQNIKKPTFEIALRIYIKELWVTATFATKILCNSLRRKLITDDILTSELQGLLQKKKLQYHEYRNLLEECLREKILTETCFKTAAAVDIHNNETNEETWLRDIATLSQKQLISDAVRTELFNTVIKKYSVSKTDVKSALDSVISDIDIRRQYTANLKFPGVMKIAKQALNN